MLLLRLRTATGAGVLAVSLASLACTESYAPESIDSATAESPLLSVYANEDAASRDLLTRTARHVALALQDRALRSQVLQALRESPYPEHKLPFKRFLRQDGGRLRDRAARTAGRTAEQFLHDVDAFPTALEFYMPVPEHVAGWDGGDDLLVATALRDGEDPVVFTLTGVEVPGVTSTTPPTTPTLVIVPAEMNFESFDESLLGGSVGAECEPTALQDCGDEGGGGGGGGGWVTGLVMTAWNFDDNGFGDGWPFGSPEYEVYASAGSQCNPFATNCMSLNRWHPELEWPSNCASEKWSQSDPRWFNTDDRDVLHTGQVQVLTRSEYDTFRNNFNDIEIIVHENDDAEDCKGGGVGLWGYPDVFNVGPSGNKTPADGKMWAVLRSSVTGFPIDTTNANIYINRLKIEVR